MRKKKIDNEYWEESTHTVLSWYFCLIATGIQLVLGLKNITTLFGQLCLVEFCFGLAGLLFLDAMHGKRGLYPKPFKKIHPNLFLRFVITFGVIVAIQFIFQIIPLITSLEFALAVVFCSVVEEYFFRGILMEPMFVWGRKAEKYTLWKYSSKSEKPDKEITLIEAGGILISSIAFAAFHVNYYGNIALMGMVFVGGLWLGFVYFWNKDLTAVILSHFMLNIIFIYQFYQVTGL